MADNTVNGNTHHSSLNIIVVGAGFGGLGAAIEFRQKGYRVKLIERTPDTAKYGDIIDFFANGGRIIQSWDNGKIAADLQAICMTKLDAIEMLKYDGKLLLKDDWLTTPEEADYTFAGNRGAMHSVVLEHAQRLGVEVLLGETVIDYKESEAAAGVVLENGREIWADCVVAADGARSLARAKVLGLEDKKVSSGWAVYRSYFKTTEEMRANVHLQDFLRRGKDSFKVWIGGDLTMLGYSWNDGADVAWVLMHRDKDDIVESWSLPARTEDALQYISHYHIECRTLMGITPPGKVIDYKLVFRRPLETWISKYARTILIGDACHCHLPSSAQGGSQALEDAVAVATCLEKVGGSTKSVPLALRIAERIRFNRSNLLHERGAKNRDEWSDIMWEKIEEDPSILKNRRENWILEYDVRSEALKHFDALKRDVISNRPGSLKYLSLPSGAPKEV